MDCHSQIKVIETKIESLNEKINTTKQLIREKAAYEYYLKTTDKDGISYQLMSKILPKIEDEINNILSNLVDFKILLNTDGKNVNAYIVYNNQYWPLELSSGMERFISAIAIRVGLINISNLPKPTFFAIDEGLGVLDSTNLNQIYLLFNYIREVFQFTMIISHIDMVRDMVDNTLTIENDRGFSKLVLN
jgi:DNA repair exonuclease SbcCD ATPase subunit